jgi:small subunit ribosomal protein S1
MELQNPNLTPEAPDESVEEALVPASEPVTPTEASSEVVVEAQAISEQAPTTSEEVLVSSEEASVHTEDDHAVAAGLVHDDSGDEEPDSHGAADSPGGFRRGELIEGRVLQKSDQEIVLDLGNGLTGSVPPREWQSLDQQVLKTLDVGSSLTVYVVKPRNSSGQPVLSINRALEEMDWREAEAHANNKQVYEGRVAGYNKGGLIVRFGRLRGFIPASQISQEREKRAQGESPDDRWSTMLNEIIAVKVVEVNRQRNRLILSERAATRESREIQKQRLISELHVNEIRQGKVISLTDFGAFVDLGGADGLIHLTELSWRHVAHPREILNIGDEVEVKVISVDPDRRRIGLSMKSLEEDPWAEVLKAYKEDQLVQARITKLTRFGAFASLLDNAEVEGLIHVSELADYRVEHPRDVVAVGDVLTLRVIKIDVERRRLGLSLKRANSSRYMKDDWSSWDPRS